VARFWPIVILGFSGIGPINEEFVRNVEGVNGAKLQGWLTKLHRLGDLARRFGLHGLRLMVALDWRDLVCVRQDFAADVLHSLLGSGRAVCERGETEIAAAQVQAWAVEVHRRQMYRPGSTSPPSENCSKSWLHT
jgi:hypothetical protein